MALPEELLDELLSAHLDDALSSDERARVDQILRDDPAARERLVAIERQRKSFRDAMLAVPKLPDGFADTVVQAAIARAEAEELRSDHPLRLAANDAFVAPQPARSFSTPRLVAMVAGLAASVLFIGLVVRQYSGDVPNRPSDNELVAAPQVIPEQDTVPDPEDLLVPLVTPEAMSDSIIGNVATDQDPVPPVADPLEDVRPEAAPVMQPVPTEQLADASSNAPVTDLPVTEATGPDTGAMPATPDTQSFVALKPLSMLMVVEIKQSEAGRQTGAFDRALAEIQIMESDERRVDEALARAVVPQPGSEAPIDEAPRALLLESPAKKLDRLVTRLVSDRDGIEAVGFSAISVQLDAPLLRSIESVRTVDPTKIRHQGQVVPIVSDADDVFDAWVSQLADRSFIPIQGEQEAQLLSAQAPGGGQLDDNGPDQMANILFLVR
ncbi:hypothetical protein Mal15_50510 [Stieleria maiorica]|uniref:Zinc-finger domain-containing protein n=1 Tax=Stieleria maiorica TaxID=2795974 RepID=A0A5B9MMV1_9BACT|nr:hypothetical protein [Stieleria maiorica]QEG00975.1 hypothetical protein Mal15_50510 [Stieleria maiorica]